MTSNWTSLFVAGSLLFVTTQIAAEEHAVLGQGKCFLRLLAQRSQEPRRCIEQDRMGSWLRDWIQSIRIQARR